MLAFEGNYLFDGHFVRDWYEGSISEIDQIVQSLPKKEFAAASDDEVFQHVRDRLTVSPLEVHDSAITMDHPQETTAEILDFGRRIRVSALRVVVRIPYTGDPDLWHLGHSPLQSIYPRGQVQPPDPDGRGILEISFTQAADDPSDTVEQDLRKEIQQIKECAERQAQTLDVMLTESEPRIRQAIERRRKQQQASGNLLEALNIPLTPKPGAPDLQSIPITKRIVQPLPSKKEGTEPEPGVAQEDYERILSVIRHMGRTMEGAPGSFRRLEEEELRDVLLAGLNAVYEGQATGETFRAKGKADIRIEDSDRIAFVAECKIWQGQRSLLDAIEQLKGYLTWRDCKACIVVFNKRNSQIRKLVAKVSEVLKNLDGLVSTEQQRFEGEYRILSRSTRDDAIQITVHVFVFDLYLAD